MSDPKRNSQWDCIILDGERYYVSKEWREASYKERGIKLTWDKMMRKALELHSNRDKA